jgi:hypothetical protein
MCGGGGLGEMQSYWEMLGAHTGHTAAGVLLDDAMPFITRKAAAAKLAQYPTEVAAKILFGVAMDESEPSALRIEAAAGLGVVWSELGVDPSKWMRLPQHLRQEAQACMPQAPPG